jgi:hypothetical protein
LVLFGLLPGNYQYHSRAQSGDICIRLLDGLHTGSIAVCDGIQGFAAPHRVVDFTFALDRY